jgi:hypothetical protein
MRCAAGSMPPRSSTTTWPSSSGRAPACSPSGAGRRFPEVVALDLAYEMLRRTPAGPAHRVQADAHHLPVATGSVDALVLVNMFLFPAEVERVLAPHGALVWVNSRGADTPDPPHRGEVDACLPGDWGGVASSAGPRHLVGPLAHGVSVHRP